MAWTGTVARDWYGRHRIVVDGVDVTFFRDAPTRLTGYQLTDPYGHGPATLEFPQVTSFEIDDLSWLHKGALVEVNRVQDGVVVDHKWFGFITVLSAQDGRVSAECAGELSGRMSLTDRQQPVIATNYDLGELVRQAWQTTNFSFHMRPEEFVVGIEIDNSAGANQDNLSYCDYLLNYARTDEGDWTLMPKPGERRTYEPRIRDMDTVHATVYLGARGVRESLSDDATEQPNRIYGQGISPTGEAWHNRKYPNLGDEYVPPFPGNLSVGDSGDSVLTLTYEMAGTPYLRRDQVGTQFTADVADTVRDLQRDAGLAITGVVNAATWAAVWGDGAEQQSFLQARAYPLVAAPEVVPFLHAANGNVIGVNPLHDRAVLRVDRSIDYGDHVTKQRATRAARQLYNRSARGNWMGTISLASDLAAGDHDYGDPITPFSRLDLEAGMNIRLKHFGQPGGILLHVSAVDVTMDGETPGVTVMVDQQGRDPLTISEIIERRRESRSDPARRHRHRRKSTFPTSAISGWDGESGAGVLSPRPLLAGWNILWTPGAQEGVIKAIEYHTHEPQCKFAIAVFSREIHKDTLNQRIGDPLAARDDDYTPWTLPAHQDWLLAGERPLLVYAAGGPNQACGYSPGHEGKIFTGVVTTEMIGGGVVTGHPITGDFKEVGDWPFHANPLLWVAVWVTDDCTGRGTFYAQTVEGV